MPDKPRVLSLLASFGPLSADQYYQYKGSDRAATPSSRASTADWDPSHRSHYATLLQPEGRFWVPGDQVSYLDGWQEGAIRSAQWVMNGTTKPRALSAPLIRLAPNANAMTGCSGPVEEHDDEE